MFLNFVFLYWNITHLFVENSTRFYPKSFFFSMFTERRNHWFRRILACSSSFAVVVEKGRNKKKLVLLKSDRLRRTCIQWWHYHVTASYLKKRAHG